MVYDYRGCPNIHDVNGFTICQLEARFSAKPYLITIALEEIGVVIPSDFRNGQPIKLSHYQFAQLRERLDAKTASQNAI